MLAITATVELRRTSRKRNVSSLGPARRQSSARCRRILRPTGSGCASRLDIVGRHWRLADELTIKEHLRIGDVRLYAQRAKLRRALDRRRRSLPARVSCCGAAFAGRVLWPPAWPRRFHSNAARSTMPVAKRWTVAGGGSPIPEQHVGRESSTDGDHEDDGNGRRTSGHW